MSVIPLTLGLSLGLVCLFVVFFLREQARSRLSSAERDAMLPLAEETPRVVSSERRNPPGASASLPPSRLKPPA
jgi:hypothetical protein